jgi:hypothetical protein
MPCDIFTSLPSYFQPVSLTTNLACALHPWQATLEFSRSDARVPSHPRPLDTSAKCHDHLVPYTYINLAGYFAKPNCVSSFRPDFPSAHSAFRKQLTYRRLLCSFDSHWVGLSRFDRLAPRLRGLVHFFCLFLNTQGTRPAVITFHMHYVQPRADISISDHVDSWAIA